MKVRTIPRNLHLINAEIRALKVLIEKRENWLNGPTATSKSTFTVIKNDTYKLKKKLENLIVEKESLLKHLKTI